MTNIVSFADGETDGFGIRDVCAHVVGATPVLLCNQRDYSGQGLACSAFVNSSSQADLKHYFAREQSIAVRVSQGKGAQRLETCWIDKRSKSRGRVDVVRRTRQQTIDGNARWLAVCHEVRKKECSNRDQRGARQ